MPYTREDGSQFDHRGFVDDGSSASSWSDDFVSACETGDLQTVSLLFLAHCKAQETSLATRRAFDAGFEAAILQSRISVVDYLIDHGVGQLGSVLGPIFSIPEPQDREHIFQRFLDTGRWKINEPRAHHVSGYLNSVLQDERLVRWFLDHGADPNLGGTHFARTPMFFAAKTANVGVLRILHENGGKLDNLLHEAIMSDTPGRREVIDYLLAHGADVSATRSAGPPTHALYAWEPGGAPLHDAIRVQKKDLVILFLQRGASLKSTDKAGRTPLQLAQAEGHDDLISLLEAAGSESGLQSLEK